MKSINTINFLFLLFYLLAILFIFCYLSIKVILLVVRYFISGRDLRTLFMREKMKKKFQKKNSKILSIRIGGNVRGGNLRRGKCLPGEMSSGEKSAGELSRGKCPRGNCPRIHVTIYGKPKNDGKPQ